VNFGSFVFNVEIVFYYTLLCCPPGANMRMHSYEHVVFA